MLAVFLVGAIAAVAGVVYVGYRVKQKASTALDDLEDKSGTHKVTSEAGSGPTTKSTRGSNAEDSSSRDADNPLVGSARQAAGSEGGSTTPMGNMAKSIFEDLGAKNPDMPPDLVRNIPWSTLTNPLPCPYRGQIDPAKLANGKNSVQARNRLNCSLWSLPLADAESDSIIRPCLPHPSGF